MINNKDEKYWEYKSKEKSVIYKIINKYEYQIRKKYNGTVEKLFEEINIEKEK